MNSENIKSITNQAIEQLIEALKAGKSEALTNYLAAVAKFHRYSFQNILLIARQCPQATRVAGFHTWRSVGRFVKKGEKGLMILAPLVRKVESADECNPEKQARIFGFRAVYVFDVSQTDGTPLPTIGVAQGEPGEYFSRLEQLVREQGISLEYSAEIAPAKGMSCGKKIILLPGMAPAEQFTTLVHELAHLCGDKIYVALGVGACRKRSDSVERGPHNTDARSGKLQDSIGMSFSSLRTTLKSGRIPG